MSYVVTVISAPEPGQVKGKRLASEIEGEQA
jgi:hypothetical protein